MSGVHIQVSMLGSGVDWSPLRRPLLVWRIYYTNFYGVRLGVLYDFMHL